MLRWAIWFHKWIALAVGVQVLGWVLGGLIMTAIPIQRVRSEHHIAKAPVAALDFDHVLPAAEVVKRAGLGGVSTATLKDTPRGPIWALTTARGGEAWYDAVSGANIDEITEAQARKAAVDGYQGSGKPVKVTYFEEAPAEAGASGALWRVDFDDAERTGVYLSAFTGEVESRRSNLWRLYNFFYQIHIMNFTPGQNYNHPAIVIVTAFTLVVVLTGFVLLWIRLARDLMVMRARKNPQKPG